MTQTAVFVLPMLGMVFLTFGIMIWMLKLRYRAIREDGLNPNYFKLNRGGKLPEYLAKVTQHYENLLEMPIFFYLAITLVVALNIIDSVYITLAWSFLLLRLIHSYIHTTSNKVAFRKNAFIASCFVLVLIWIKITINLFSL